MGDAFRDLGPEAEVVDRVGEGVRLAVGGVEVVVQIVHVHRTVGETSSGGDVEITNHLVDPEATFDATSLVALRVQFLAVVLALALFDVFTFAERPAGGGVGFAHFLASVAATLFLHGGRGGGAIAVSAVVGGEVGGFFIAVQVQRCDLDGETALGAGGELDFGEAVFHACLLLAGDVHYVEGEELAGDAGEGDVEMDFHSFAWGVDRLGIWGLAHAVRFGSIAPLPLSTINSGWTVTLL